MRRALGVSANLHDVTLADMNGDGYLDVLLATDGGGVSRLWINDGAANFALDNRGYDSSEPTFKQLVVDVDQDGDLDIVECNGVGQINRLFENDGSGNFVPGMDFALTDGSHGGGAFGDFDGDGDVDFLFASPSASGLSDTALNH